MMAKCGLCSAKKGKRYCASLDNIICPVCCGENRMIKIDCIDDCRYLEGVSYQQKRLEDKEISQLMSRVGHGQYDDPSGKGLCLGYRYPDNRPKILARERQARGARSRSWRGLRSGRRQDHRFRGRPWRFDKSRLRLPYRVRWALDGDHRRYEIFRQYGQERGGRRCADSHGRRHQAGAT